MKLTDRDWRDLAKNRLIRTLFNICNSEDEKAFVGSQYAVKFAYISESPGYAGDLFVILGGEAECPPVVALRHDRKVEVVDSTNY